MNINFIAYLDPSVHHGGGEQITSTLIEEGERRGHRIYKTFQNPLSAEYMQDAHLNIIWDLYNCPEQNNPFDNEFIERILKSAVPYIYGTGGYEDICSLGTLPCRGETDGDLCNVSRSHRTFGEGGIYRRHPKKCIANKRSALLKGAKVCIFFSELQKEFTEKTIGEINSFIATPPVGGLEKYYNQNLNRDIDLLSYGGHLEYKGFFNILEAFPDRECLFIGGGPPALPELYGYGRLVGKIPQERMPEILNRTKTFVHLPRWPEPYGITTLQAALCGCEVIENENSVVLKDNNINELVTEIKKWEQCGPIWDQIEKICNEH
jgi:glycosyltransferase involved in cell wall biosynthesis